MNPTERGCTSFQSMEQLMQWLNKRANRRWIGQQDDGILSSREERVVEPRTRHQSYTDSSCTKRCVGADGPGFNPKCWYWILPTEERCPPCMDRMNASVEKVLLDNKPHIRMFPTSKRVCTLTPACGGSMQAYTKTFRDDRCHVVLRELWWRCIRCGGTRLASETTAKSVAEAQYKCDGKSPRITCDCPKCCYYFQDQNNATNACSAFLSEAKEQADHIRSILKDQEMK